MLASHLHVLCVGQALPTCCHFWELSWTLSSSVNTPAWPHPRHSSGPGPFCPLPDRVPQTREGTRHFTSTPQAQNFHEVSVRWRQLHAVHHVTVRLSGVHTMPSSGCVTLACLCLSFLVCHGEITQAELCSQSCHKTRKADTRPHGAHERLTKDWIFL